METKEKIEVIRKLCEQIENYSYSNSEYIKTINRNQLSGELRTITLPKYTDMLIVRNEPDIIVLEWENLKTQHCVTLNVDLNKNTADYEYSNVCSDEDELRSFPVRPLNSDLVEKYDINLDHKKSWNWLQARLKATGKFGR